MSFSSDIKDKLCNVGHTCPSCAVSELAGALLFGGSIGVSEIKFNTENEKAAKRIVDDIASCFGINAPVTRVSRVIKINIDDVFEAENIIDGLPLIGEIPFYCCRAAFVRGAFLGGGSVSNPQRGYHMEFDTRKETDAQRLRDILNKDGFNSKITCRKGRYVVYIKGSEEIADILGYMGAPNFAFELFNIQAEKEMRNDINRRVNCENANTNKAAKASSRHLFAISRIKTSGQWDKLPDSLVEIALLREEYPEDSLKELGEKTKPPIGKSGVNHRLNRILEIAENI